MFDVVTIGTATRDAFVKSKDFHVDPDHHVLGGKALVMPLGAKIEIPEIYFSTGGGSTNSAVTFSKQGLKTACISVVGEDISGKTVMSELKKYGVDTRFVKFRKKLPTAYSILLELVSGERTVLVYRGAAATMGSQDISWSKIKTGWLYLSSVAGDLDLLKKIIQFARPRGIYVAYNPGGKELKQKSKLLPLLQDISVVIANREEASLISGVSPENELGIFKVWDQMCTGINVMTDARRGVLVSDGKYLYRTGIYKEKQVVDRTGAGDAFGSGFVAGIIHQVKSWKLKVSSLTPEAIEYAIKLGSANATSKIEGLGAKFGLLSREDFEKSRRWKTLQITRTPLI